MSNPQKTYLITLAQIDSLVNEIAILDGMRVVDACIDKKLHAVNAAYAILEHTLGDDAALVFPGGDE